jgi:hypothetical protein
VTVDTARSDPPTPRALARGAAAGAGVGGAQKGEEDPAAGAPRIEE